MNLVSLAELIGPSPPRCPLNPTVLSAVDCGVYVRQNVEYAVEEAERIKSLLLLPKNTCGTAPAVIAHHQHAGQFDLGESEVVGLAGDADQAYGAELAERGHVVIAPDALKVAIVDNTALVSGANLTDDAFNRNVEVGIMVTNSEFLVSAKTYFASLIAEGTLCQLERSQPKPLKTAGPALSSLNRAGTPTVVSGGAHRCFVLIGFGAKRFPRCRLAVLRSRSRALGLAPSLQFGRQFHRPNVSSRSSERRDGRRVPAQNNQLAIHDSDLPSLSNAYGLYSNR